MIGAKAALMVESSTGEHREIESIYTASRCVRKCCGSVAEGKRAACVDPLALSSLSAESNEV